MIPTIKQVMKCYRVIVQIERMKTGRPGDLSYLKICIILLSNYADYDTL